MPRVGLRCILLPRRKLPRSSKCCWPRGRRSMSWTVMAIRRRRVGVVVVFDEDLGLHVEACAYLAGLRATGRIALYLSYCLGRGVDWSSPSLA